MEKSFYLEDISIEAAKNPRHFLKPTDEELDNLKIGEMVRLFFVLKEQRDNCRAERMWVEIEHIEKDTITGYLTNQPFYIEDIQIGDIIAFNRKNIATVIVENSFDENKQAIISKRALEHRAVNWLLREEPSHDNDSGWQLYYGDEDDDYANQSSNYAIISLSSVLDFEPRLEKAFASSHDAFEWDDDSHDFIASFNV